MIMVKSLLLLLVLAACAVMGCSARTQIVKTVEDGAGKDVIEILIKADPQLNLFEKSAHALLLCLYQLKDPDGFNQLERARGGVPKLLDCGRFDATVVDARQFVVQPGEDLADIRDRGEGARYIGVATGYYSLGKEKVTGLSPLSTGGNDGSSGGVVRIELGPHEIRSVRVR